MTVRKVIALGNLPKEPIASVLGENFDFVTEPSETDMETADAAIVRAEFLVDERFLTSARNLKVIARTGVGVDRVDVAAATKLGVSVLITPGANSSAVAEGTIAQMLAVAKRLSELTELVRDSNWSHRENYKLLDLEGSTLGLVGFGRIGKRVAELAEAFGMKVLAFDPFAEVPEMYSVRSLQDLLSKSNFLSIHVPLTDETRDLISAKEINLLPAGSVVVNCSRGGIVNLDAAYEAVVSGQLHGLGLDSFDPEPAVWHKVFDLPNVVLTPHVMGLSERAKLRTFEHAAQAIRDFFEGKTTFTSVNPQVERR